MIILVFLGVFVRSQSAVAIIEEVISTTSEIEALIHKSLDYLLFRTALTFIQTNSSCTCSF